MRRVNAKRGQVSFLRLMRGGSPYPPRHGGRKRGGYGDPPRKTYVIPLSVLVLALWAGGAAWAAAIPGEAQRIAGIQAEMMAGNTDEAIKAARDFLKTARDENAKTEALRVIADGLRKSGDWRGAAGAYRGLCDRFEKTSDNSVRCAAIADVLAASQNGIYKGSPKIKPAPGTQAKTLSDDNALEAALTLLARSRSAKLRTKGMSVRRARTPQDVMNLFRPLAEEARQIFLLSANTPPDDARSVGTMAAQRLAQIYTQVTSVLQKKLQAYREKMKRREPGSFTKTQKKDIEDTQQTCKEMAAAEKEFQQALTYVSGSGEWPEGESFRVDSTERAAAYEQLAKEYVVPAYSDWGYFFW